jgi:hypothetical protein
VAALNECLTAGMQDNDFRKNVFQAPRSVSHRPECNKNHSLTLYEKRSLIVSSPSQLLYRIEQTDKDKFEIRSHDVQHSNMRIPVGGTPTRGRPNDGVLIKKMCYI